VLLLLDYWPLNRLENISLKEPSSRQTIFRLAREKIPLFVLSAICSTITFLAQRSGGTVAELAKFPLGFRLANAVLSYAKYIGNTFWPKDLAVFYPLSGDELSSGWVLFPLAFLLVASIRVVQFAPNHRYLPVGWFWFLGTLVPVIGIVQSGSQALADRYAYIPLVGLFIITVWGFDEYFPKIRYRKAALGLLALMSLSALTICTRIQVRFWQNSITLWEQTLKVTQNNGAVHDNFATALAEKGRYEEAIEHYRIALKMLQNPNSDMLYNIGCVYSNLERYTEAVEPFRQAIKIKPDCIEAYIGLGKTLGMLGRHTEVIEVCQQAIKIKPDSAEAYFNLGAAYISQSRWAEAIEATKQAVRIKPASAQAHYNLGLAFLNAGDKNSALRQYDILKQLDPHFADALLRKIQK
jgi:tetratricopeptide (TPR) repeat protein